MKFYLNTDNGWFEEEIEAENLDKAKDLANEYASYNQADMYIYDEISIHASLAICVGDCLRIFEFREYFNPRISCEMRLSTFVKIGKYPNDFNPRISCEMRLRFPQARQLYKLYFNPRISCEMRLNHTISCHLSVQFQSTHLLRDASREPIDYVVIKPISIHASLARCVFNHFVYRKEIIYISIHASLARCVY